MFKKHNNRRSTNIVFVIFRLVLSMLMFGLLLGGAYQAYRYFSGLDPLKFDTQVIVRQLLEVLSVRINQKIPRQFVQNNQPGLENLTNSLKYTFRFLLVADSHNDNANLKKTISKVKQQYPDLSFIIGLGDYTEVGTPEELKKAKVEFDLSNLRYFLLAGDHDLWDSRNRNLSVDTNFKAVFGPLYQSFTFNNFRFLLLDNSDNYAGIGPEQQKWITEELEKAKDEGVLGILVFIHEPLFHPSSDHFMGRVERQLKQQARSLIFQLKAGSVKKVFAGDTHYFSEYEEPETKLSMVTVGAVVTDRNPQVPRFAVVSVFEDGSTKVEDIEIK